MSTTKQAKDAPDAPDAPAPDQMNAVIVVRTKDEQGNINFDVQTTGNVEIDQVQFALEQGIKRFRQMAGLD